MRDRLIYVLFLMFVALFLPSQAHAQEARKPFIHQIGQVQVPSATLFQNSQSGRRDSLWNGVLIGAGVGAAVGMLIAPQGFCGAHDTECATIVRVVIGLPAIAGGIGIGALVDGLNSRRDARPSGVQISWKF